MNTQQSYRKDNQPNLSASEYLWLQHEKQRLAQMDMDIVRIQYRQDRHLVWIALLALTVILLGVGLLFTLAF